MCKWKSAYEISFAKYFRAQKKDVICRIFYAVLRRYAVESLS